MCFVVVIGGNEFDVFVGEILRLFDDVLLIMQCMIFVYEFGNCLCMLFVVDYCGGCYLCDVVDMYV